MKILFVCIGNTCRSPMAESVMEHWVMEHNLKWKVDSAGLKHWNVGRSPEPRCLKVLDENGLSSSHVGRMITWQDFHYFDYILGMDYHNMKELEAMAKSTQNAKAQIRLLGSYLDRTEDEVIQDPYFSQGMTGFRCAFDQITESCQNFIYSHKEL